MATDRQLAANRLNALESRGPKTDEGRAASRRNAMKHGLTARSLVIEGEHASRFEELRAELFDAYQPQGIVDAQLIDMMAGILWRLHRVPALEAAAFSWMQSCHRYHSLVGPESVPVTDEVQRIRTNAKQKKQNLGRAVFHLVRDGDLLDKLNRYEAQLLNQLTRISSELEKRRNEPNSAMAIAALAIE